jgi:hypothetical protein
MFSVQSKLVPLLLAIPLSSSIAFANQQQTYDQSLEFDAIEYTKSHRVSLLEAKRRLVIQNTKSELIEEIKNKYRSRIAGIFLEHDPVFKIVVRLKGGQPVSNFVKSLKGDNSPLIYSIPVTFETGALETKEEGELRLKSQIDSLKKKIDNLQGAWFDEKTGGIFLLVYTNGDTTKSTIQEEYNLTKENLGLPYKIILTNEKYQDSASIRGGALISNVSNSADFCTSGFAIKNSVGTKYMTTAAHCSDNLKDNASGATFTLVGQVKNATKDLQWHSVSSTHTILPEFFADSQTVARKLTGRRTRASTTVGDNVCHQGRKTGYSCGYVAQTNFIPTYSGACGTSTCSPVWVRVVGKLSSSSTSTLKCYPGDSGGPVFASQTAFGLLKGTLTSGVNAGQCTEFYYMSTDEIYNQGFSLLY